MPKTERILGHLPSTFRAGRDPSALRAVAGAVGSELQAAENRLAAVLRAHWVDHADAGRSRIHDLALLGALYGLAPRDDESVEEFREHLKRYVRTFLEGTVTVRGLLRVTAETLGLHIADDDLDTWWDRPGDHLVTALPRGDDAAPLLLGSAALAAAGSDATPARVRGTADLGEGVDLRQAGVLRLALDGGAPAEVDLAAAAPDPAAVTAGEVVAAVNDAVGAPVAGVAGARVSLTSTTAGPGSRIEVPDGPGDAAPAVLGLRPRSVRGSDATAARVVGTPDLGGGADLSSERFLRVAVDGAAPAEIDCAAAAADPAAVTAAEIVAAVNDGLGAPVASSDGTSLTLTSPTLGAGSIVHVQSAAAQDAARRLLGPVDPITLGAPDRPARIVGDRDLGAGVDLTGRARLRLSVDGDAAVTVDVSGADPSATTPAEIVAALNAALGAPVASSNGRFLTLSSPTPGAAGSLAVEDVPEDAAEAVLGLAPRSVTGGGATTARVVGEPDLGAGVDLSARHVLAVGLDAADPVEVDLFAGAADPRRATLDELAGAIDAALGAGVASHDGARLSLASPTAGAAGAVAVGPLERVHRRRFVTRAVVTDDAASAVFGFAARRAVGVEATRARIDGTSDLSRGVDLRGGRHLRLRVDGGPALEIDCAGARPRATTAAEVVAAVNDAVGEPVAGSDGRTLALVSPTPGPGGRLDLEATRALDALAVLGVAPVTARGRDASGVAFVGTADLGAGVALPAGAALALGVDGGAPAEVVVGDVVDAERTLSQIVAAINGALVAPVAAHDGRHVLLNSPTAGAGSRLDIAVPAGPDATQAVLGIPPGRTYRGAAAGAAEVVGDVDLGAGADLRRARYLRVAVDGGPADDIDLAAGADTPGSVTAEEVAAAVNAAGGAIADTVGGRLRLRSPGTGSASRLGIERSDRGDARAALLGAAPTTAIGVAPAPAVLAGEADLRLPVDLAANATVRIAVDGAAPVDVDVAGGAPAATTLAEVVAAIETALPGTARATDDDRVQLTSPSAGAGSSVEVLALRHLEIEEYPPRPVSRGVDVGDGEPVVFRNDGAADVPATVELAAADGMLAPVIAAPAAGWAVQVRVPVPPGARLEVSGGDRGEVSAVVHTAGGPVPVPDADVAVDTLAAGAAARPLAVIRGRNRWVVFACLADRFDAAVLDDARFAGLPCDAPGVFDVARFDGAVFAPGDAGRTTAVTVRWQEHEPGALRVNLPAELDPRFGLAFNEGRFGAAQPERFPGVVTEPPDDPAHVLAALAGSRLVEARLTDTVPIGWSPVAMPFRDPQPLVPGTRDAGARLYLSEEGLDGRFLEVRARHAGVAGAQITVSAEQAAPATYDLEVAFPGPRYEHARRSAAGRPLPVLVDELLEPGAVGVLTAKAAGVRAEITRDRTSSVSPAGEGDANA